MKHLIAVVFVLLSTPSLAGVITYDFTRLTLGADSQKSSLAGQITFDQNETQFNRDTWLSFFFLPSSSLTHASRRGAPRARTQSHA